MSRSRYQRSEAIVLCVYPANEKDLKVVLLHAQDGKRYLNARGARASRRGVLAVLQPGNRVEVLLYRSADHDTLQQADIKESLLSRISSPAQLHCLHYFLWLVRHWCEWGTPVEDIYELLGKAIDTLPKLDEARLGELKRRFEQALLRIQGLQDDTTAPPSFQRFQAIFADYTHQLIPAQFLEHAA